MVTLKYFTTAETSNTGFIRDGVAVTGTNTYYSTKWHSWDGQAIDYRAVGTMTGTFTLWYSNKESPNEATDADWHQDTGFTATNPAGADSKSLDETSNSKCRWKRMKYVNASGSGTIFGYMVRPTS